MKANDKDIDYTTMTLLLDSLSKSSNGLLDFIHFLSHYMSSKEEAEAFLMYVLVIKANIKMFTDGFIETSKSILGNDFVEEKMKNFDI